MRAPKLVDMEGISRKFNINIRIFEPKTNSEKALFLVTIITGCIGKTAYEIGVRLVGSEMCIRDRIQRSRAQ